MKKIFLAGLTVLSLGAGSAFAQGMPAGLYPYSYTEAGSPAHRNDPQVHFLGQGTVIGKIFGHSNSDQANRTETSAKGG
jgi:hypothetical protein